MFHKEGYKIILIATIMVGVGIICIENFISLNCRVLNKMTCPDCNVSYLINNRYNHMTSSKHW